MALHGFTVNCIWRNLPYAKVMHAFDPRRADFMPYGFTCERWMPERMKRPDRHNEIELNLILEGEIVYRFGGRTVALREGHLGAFWASVPHQIISCIGNAPYFVATIPLPWFLACHPPGSLAQQLLNGAVLIEYIGQRERLDKELFLQWMEDLRQPDTARQRIALMEMEARIHRLARNAEPHQPMLLPQGEEPLALDADRVEKVERIAYFIAQNYTERLTVEQIARYVDLHPNYAMELFRRTLGTTLLDYINHHRVAHAQRLLLTSDESILEIALQSGFHSLSRFNAVFKNRSGCTPRAYRRNHRLPLPVAERV